VRHGKKGRQLSRDTKHRGALFRNLVTSLLDHERIETTAQKAKEIRGYAERMITLGKRGGLENRRRALSFIRDKAVVSKLFSEVAGRFRDRSGGYTRIIKTRQRSGDAAAMVAIELVAKGGGTAAPQTGKTDAAKKDKPSEQA